MKAWITGSHGFVGSALKKVLPKYDFQVTRITNTPSKNKGALFINYESRESIRSAIVLDGVPDVMFHLGWGNVYEPQLDVHLNQNFLSTKNLMDGLYENGLKKFILIGSSSEYGSREGCLKEDYPPVGCLTNYAQGKIKACNYGFEVAKKYNKIFIHIRLFHTLGAGHRQNSLINQLHKSAHELTALNLSPCDQFRDYIYISDAVEGMAMISKVDSSEIINLGGGSKILLKDLINMFWRKLDVPVDLLKFGAHERSKHEPVQPPCYASLEKLKRLTGWQPTISIEEAVSKTIEELRMNYQ